MQIREIVERDSNDTQHSEKESVFTFFFPIHSGSEGQVHDVGQLINRCNEAFRESSLPESTIRLLKANAEKAINTLNFHSGPRSVGVFVTPNESHLSLYYTDLPERHYRGDFFAAYESLWAEAASAPYLLFVLTGSTINVYEGRGTHLQLKSSNDELKHLQTIYKHRISPRVDKDGRHNKGHVDDAKAHHQLVEALASVCSAASLPAIFVGLGNSNVQEQELKSAGVDCLAIDSANHQDADIGALRQSVQTLLGESDGKGSAEIIARCTEACGQQLLASGLDEIVACVDQGRAELLVLEEPAGGDAKETQTLSPMENAIRTTLAKHGKVVFVPAGSLARWEGAALILRY